MVQPGQNKKKSNISAQQHFAELRYKLNAWLNILSFCLTKSPDLQFDEYDAFARTNTWTVAFSATGLAFFRLVPPRRYDVVAIGWRVRGGGGKGS